MKSKLQLRTGLVLVGAVGVVDGKDEEEEEDDAGDDEDDDDEELKMPWINL